MIRSGGRFGTAGAFAVQCIHGRSRFGMRGFLLFFAGLGGRIFDGIFDEFAGVGVDIDLVKGFGGLDVEGVDPATVFFFQFSALYLAGLVLEGKGARLSEGEFGDGFLRGEQGSRREQCREGEEMLFHDLSSFLWSGWGRFALSHMSTLDCRQMQMK